MSKAEAFVEVNDPHVAVRMRRVGYYGDWVTLILSDAGLVQQSVEGFRAYAEWNNRKTKEYGPISFPQPRLAASDTHTSTYFELLHLEDSNAVADTLKAKLIELGYELTTEKFPI